MQRPVRELSPGAKIMFGVLMYEARRKDYCQPKLKALAHTLGVSVDSARRYLRELEHVALIETEPTTTSKGRTAENKIFFLAHRWMKADKLRTPATLPVEPSRQRINLHRHSHGAFLPFWLVGRRETSAGCKLAYARLNQYAGANGSCHPSNDEMAFELGVSTGSVSLYLQTLTSEGLIEIEPTKNSNGGTGRNRIYFLAHAWLPTVWRGGQNLQETFQETLPGTHPQNVQGTPPQNLQGSIYGSNQNQKKKNQKGGNQSGKMSPPQNEADAFSLCRPYGLPECFVTEKFHYLQDNRWKDRYGTEIENFLG